MGLTGSPDRVPHGETVGHGHVELPAEVADVGDTRGEHGLARDRDLAAGAEGEALVAHVGIGDGREDRAGVGAPQADGGDVIGEVGERRALSGVVLEPLEVAHAVRAAGDHAEVVIAEAHDGEVGAEAAVGGEHRGVDDLAHGDVHLAHADLLHGGQRARTGDVEEREGGEVHQACGLAHLQVLGVDDGRPPAGLPLGGARHHGVAVLLDEPGVGLVVEGALPLDRLVEDGAEGLLALVVRRETDLAVGRPLLGGVHDAVGLVEALRRAVLDVLGRRLAGVEARDVGGVQIDLGLAEHHPLGHGASDTRTLLDPHGGGGPQALDLGGLAEDRHAVGGEGEQAVDGVLLLGVLVADDLGHELECVLVLIGEVLRGEGELGGGERGLGVRGDVLCVVEDRAVGVGADLQARAVLALVHVGVHVADDGVLQVALGVGEHRHGADVLHLVHGGRERDLSTGHSGDLAAPAAGGDDDVLGLDRALVGDDGLDAAIGDRQVLDLDVGEGLQGAHLDGLLAHERAGAQGVAHADALGVEAAEDDGLVDEGDHLLDLIRREQAHVLDAPRLARGDAAGELLHALGRARDLDAAGLEERVELLVLREAVERELRHLLVVVDEEDEVGRVAGGAARIGQRALVDLDDVAPAQARQVVGHGVAHDAGADDDALGLARQGAHCLPLEWC